MQDRLPLRNSAGVPLPKFLVGLKAQNPTLELLIMLRPGAECLPSRSIYWVPTSCQDCSGMRGCMVSTPRSCRVEVTSGGPRTTRWGTAAGSPPRAYQPAPGCRSVCEREGERNYAWESGRLQVEKLRSSPVEGRATYEGRGAGRQDLGPGVLAVRTS